MTNLPESQDATPALLIEQAALFDDPQTLLKCSVSELRVAAVAIARTVHPTMAEIRRVVGLVCWAMRAKVPTGEYGKWVEGYAEMVGVTARTLGEWRTKAEKSAGAVPAYSAPRKQKTAGQTAQLEETSKPIPAVSHEAPAKPSAGSGPGMPQTRPGVAALADPSSGGADVQRPAAPTGEAPTSPPSAPPGPETEAEQFEMDAYGLRWLKSKTTREVRAISDPWGPAIRSEVKRWAEAFGFTEAKRPGLSVAKLVQAGSTGPVPIPPPRYDLKPPPRTGSRKGHALDCSCLGCKPAKAVAK